MGTHSHFRQIRDCVYEAPETASKGMRGPARIFADEDILSKAEEDGSLQQLLNTATLPGLVGAAMAMPDCHLGYGFPIGGVVATDARDGVVSPGGVGYDINCGVRLLRTPLVADEVKDFIGALADAIFRACPSGVGSRGSRTLSASELDDVLISGARWAVAQGYGVETDLENTEDRGALGTADPDVCSHTAKKRGQEQLGTLGAGNHFIEVDYVAKLHDDTTARLFGLTEGTIAIQIHCGSRGLGHQICTDSVSALQKTSRSFRYTPPDKQLACAPLASEEGERYLAAMAAAANYAWANRQVLTHGVRRSFHEVLGDAVEMEDISTVYDIAHNIARMETHEVDGRNVRVCVHRKGATRALPAGHPGVPERYRAAGQPVLVPGSMGTRSYVLAGNPDSLLLSLGSSSHGAGRLLSRKSSKKSEGGREVFERLSSKGIVVRTESFRGLAEERPEAYKDVDTVVSVIQRTGLARIVAELHPLAVVKG